MNIAFRTDASRVIGHGHVMRCLTLAADLKTGNILSFVCREAEGDLCSLIESRGFKVIRLGEASGEAKWSHDSLDHATWLGASWDQDASETCVAIEAENVRPDWLIVDHYAIDQRWEGILRPRVENIMVIDDLADRAHDCDILLDQNYFANGFERYRKLLRPYCARFLGPEYVLLRDEFRTAAHCERVVGPPQILLFFGGGDPERQTETALDALASFDPTLAIDVVVGGANPRASAIEKVCRSMPRARFFHKTESISKLMAKATLSLGAGGIATFERLHMRLPSIVVATAANQREPLQALAGIGCIEYLGDAAQIDSLAWISALERWRAGKIKQKSLEIGTRVERLLNALRIKLVPFAERHIEGTFQFIQDNQVRNSFSIKEEPEWDTHVNYWKKKIAQSVERIFAIERGSEHIGNCGLKPMPGSDDSEGWIYLSEAATRRTGSGEIAFRRLLRVAFNELALPRLYLHVKRNNARALSLYRKIGFESSSEKVDATVWGDRAPDMCKLVISQ